MVLRSLGRILLASLLLVVSGTCVSDNLMGPEQVMPTIEVLEDSENIVTADSVRDLPASRWHRIQDKTPSFGFSRSAYWAHFSHKNVSNKREKLYIEVGYSLLNDVTLYQWHEDNLRLEANIGNKFPFHQRLVQHRNLIFPVTIPANSQEDFYLRIKSNSALQFPISIWRRDVFHAQDQYSIFQHGIYYGLVFVMVIYNFFLYLQIRDKVYLLYVFYVATFSLTQLALSGFAYQILWSEYPIWNQISIAVTTPAIVAFGCVFVAQTLKLKEYAPLLNYFPNILAVIGVMLSVSGLFFPYHIMIKLAATLVIFSCCTALYASYYMWLRENQRFAAYFSAAWTVFLFGVVFLALNKFGVIPRTFFTESAAQFGSGIEIILLSYALADRLRAAHSLRLKAEREARLVNEKILVANEKILAVQQEVTTDLEQKFQMRTRELHAALEKVQSLNSELTEISHTDQLTGARNRRFMDEFLSREIQRANRYDRPLSFIMIDIDHFKLVNDQYGHPVGDLCLKKVTFAIKSQLRRCQDEACRYGGEEIAVILPDTPLQGAFLHAERIRKAVESLQIEYGNVELKLTVSIGVASTEQVTLKDPLALTTAADQALYQAKHKGRNRVHTAEPICKLHWLSSKPS